MFRPKGHKGKNASHEQQRGTYSSSSDEYDDLDEHTPMGQMQPEHHYQPLAESIGPGRSIAQPPVFAPHLAEQQYQQYPQYPQFPQHQQQILETSNIRAGPRKKPAKEYYQRVQRSGFPQRESFQATEPPPPYTPSPQGQREYTEMPAMGRLTMQEYGNYGERSRGRQPKQKKKRQQQNHQGYEDSLKGRNPRYETSEESKATEERDRQMRKNDFIRNNCQQVGDVGDVNVYLPNSRVTFEDKTKRIRKVEIGNEKPGTKVKVIMIVGATGSGKTTLINGMYNYVLGVKWEDDHRLKLIQEAMQGQEANQAQSQTSWITSYTIHHEAGFTVPYTLTIIDTPGFGDTAGIKRDQEITEQIRICFTTPGLGGVDSIDAVGFVAQSALNRLTPSQKYIFDSILSLFGKDIGDNIFMLLTFADGQKPQVLSGIKEAQIPYKKFFKFNNSALFASNKGSTEQDEYSGGSDSNFDEMFWKMGVKSFRIFMTDLGKAQAKSLLLTKNVLEERNRLEVAVEGIQKDIKMGLNKLDQLRTEHRLLDHHQSDIDKNQDFMYVVNEQEIIAVPTPSGQYTTTCTTCNWTCHERCAFANDSDKARCVAMGYGSNGECCKICDQHCHWTCHRNLPYVYEIKINQVTKTAEDLKQRYEEAKGKKLDAEQLVQECLEEFEEVQMRVLNMVDQARQSIVRLNEIALKMNPLSTVDYIDILIRAETNDAKPGWKERVEQLSDVKKKAEQIQEIAEDGYYDPFAIFKQQYEDEKEQRKQMRQQQLNQ